MADTGGERVGVLVVRVWLEQQAMDRLRARITRRLDISRPPEEVTTAASIDEICTIVPLPAASDDPWVVLVLAACVGEAGRAVFGDGL
jgi:hypothetical protein